MKPTCGASCVLLCTDSVSMSCRVSSSGLGAERSHSVVPDVLKCQRAVSVTFVACDLTSSIPKKKHRLVTYITQCVNHSIIDGLTAWYVLTVSTNDYIIMLYGRP